jgi:hypothetical protein
MVITGFPSNQIIIIQTCYNLGPLQYTDVRQVICGCSLYSEYFDQEGCMKLTKI